jgi:hypothetical protein
MDNDDFSKDLLLFLSLFNYWFYGSVEVEFMSFHIEKVL